MTNVGGATNTWEAQSRNMMNFCTKHGFDILIISGSYGGHRRHTTYDGRRITPRVWHKLPTGELKMMLLKDKFPVHVHFSKHSTAGVLRYCT